MTTDLPALGRLSEEMRRLYAYLTEAERAALSELFRAYYELAMRRAALTRQYRIAEVGFDHLRLPGEPDGPDELDVLGAAKSHCYVEIAAALNGSRLPAMKCPTGLKKVDGSSAGCETLADRLTLWLCMWLDEQARQDIGVGDLNSHSVWRDRYVADGIKKCLGDLASVEPDPDGLCGIMRTTHDDR